MVAPPAPSGLQRTSLQLYRDCHRLIRHIAPGSSPKSVALKALVRNEFAKNRNEIDEARIESLKANAVRALSNYMLYESGLKDTKMNKAMDRFHDASVKETRNVPHGAEKAPIPNALDKKGSDEGKEN